MFHVRTIPVVLGSVKSASDKIRSSFQAIIFNRKNRKRLRALQGIPGATEAPGSHRHSPKKEETPPPTQPYDRLKKDNERGRISFLEALMRQAIRRLRKVRYRATSFKCTLFQILFYPTPFLFKPYRREPPFGSIPISPRDLKGCTKATGLNWKRFDH
jgi:hypothetical protein